MHKIITILIFISISFEIWSQDKLIHVFVALCDNEYQGIVPVPESLGDGTDPKSNLYWGAGYGVRNFFDKKAEDWILVSDLESDNSVILDRVLFKHIDFDVYLLADAYEGEYIQRCIEDFLLSSSGQNSIEISIDRDTLKFGGSSDLVAYVGHNGLMDFEVDLAYDMTSTDKCIDAILLGCYTKSYFNDYLKSSGANPILWTTHLMAPEAYTLHSAIGGWIKGETGQQIDERAAQTYNKYQNCGINGARNLFTTGF